MNKTTTIYAGIAITLLATLTLAIAPGGGVNLVNDPGFNQGWRGWQLTGASLCERDTTFGNPAPSIHCWSENQSYATVTYGIPTPLGYGNTTVNTNVASDYYLTSSGDASCEFYMNAEHPITNYEDDNASATWLRASFTFQWNVLNPSDVEFKLYSHGTGRCDFWADNVAWDV